jgi:hypothetical protein
MVEKRIKRRKAAGARRETIVKVLVTDSEHAAIRAAAERDGLSVSTWLRLAGIRAAAERA